MKRARSIAASVVLSGILIGGLTIGPRAPALSIRGADMFSTHRLLKAVNAYLEEHPDDPRATYCLARIHYLIFRNRTWFALMYWDEGEDPLPRFPTNRMAPGNVDRDWVRDEAWKRARKKEKKFRYPPPYDHHNTDINALHREEIKRLEKEGLKPTRMSDKRALEYAGKSLEYFDKAIELKPDDGLYYLGRANLLEQWLARCEDTDAAPDLRPATTREDIIADYRKARELSIDEDRISRKKDHVGITSYIGLVSDLAAEGLERLRAEGFEVGPKKSLRRDR